MTTHDEYIDRSRHATLRARVAEAEARLDATTGELVEAAEVAAEVASLRDAGDPRVTFADVVEARARRAVASAQHNEAAIALDRCRARLDRATRVNAG